TYQSYHCYFILPSFPTRRSSDLAALPAPVVARLHREPEVAEAVLPLEVHAVERVRDPADPALAERDPDVGVALEDGGPDHCRQNVDEVHLETGHAREEGRAAGLTRLPLAD